MYIIYKGGGSISGEWGYTVQAVYGTPKTAESQTDHLSQERDRQKIVDLYLRDRHTST